MALEEILGETDRLRSRLPREDSKFESQRQEGDEVVSKSEWMLMASHQGACVREALRGLGTEAVLSIL